jgi:hypothetical protein
MSNNRHRLCEYQRIELPDDGLRVMRTGTVRGYRMVCLHNPGLIAEVIAERAVRRMIRQANERLFS